MVEKERKSFVIIGAHQPANHLFDERAGARWPSAYDGFKVGKIPAFGEDPEIAYYCKLSVSQVLEDFLALFCWRFSIKMSGRDPGIFELFYNDVALSD